MQIFTPADLSKYQIHDSIIHALNVVAQPHDEIFTSHRWLLESAPKRMIFDQLYGDLLFSKHNLHTVLDVGGGFTALTRVLIRQHKYFLLDLMAHDSSETIHLEETSLKNNFWINDDWYQFEPPMNYDIIIANDIFPNVDQRLEIFIDRYLPYCREMRLSLTYYNSPRWYKVKRVDADEVFHMLAWDGVQLGRVLETYAARMDAPAFESLLHETPSLFKNQRQVCSVVLRGDC